MKQTNRKFYHLQTLTSVLTSYLHATLTVHCLLTVPMKALNQQFHSASLVLLIPPEVLDINQ